MSKEWKTPLGQIAPTPRTCYGLHWMERYFLSVVGNETEVTQAQFCEAERSAGFRPKMGEGPTATSGFGADVINGRVEMLSGETEK